MVAAADLKFATERCVGSNPSTGTNLTVDIGIV